MTVVNNLGEPGIWRETQMYQRLVNNKWCNLICFSGQFVWGFFGDFFFVVVAICDLLYNVKTTFHLR